jgi:hypothetical protein
MMTQQFLALDYGFMQMSSRFEEEEEVFFARKEEKKQAKEHHHHHPATDGCKHTSEGSESCVTSTCSEPWNNVFPHNHRSSMSAECTCELVGLLMLSCSFVETLTRGD